MDRGIGKGVFVVLLGFWGTWGVDEAAGQTAGKGRKEATSRRTGEKAKFVSNVPAGRWIGQDGKDIVGPASVPVASDVQDIHIALGGLPRAKLVWAKVGGLGGGEWLYNGPHGPWRAEIEREGLAANADLYIEPGQVETGRPFDVILRFEDGREAHFSVQGGKADPNLRMPGAVLTARWEGAAGEDRVGTGPSVGPDGLIDAAVGLSNLSKTQEVALVTVRGPNGMTWESGTNPKGLASAELIRKEGDPTRGTLSLAFERDPKGMVFQVEVAYKNNTRDQAKFTAGSFDPRRKTARAPASKVSTIKLATRWLGQDGDNHVGPGDVHVAIEGLPPLGVVGAALSNPSRGIWSVKASDRLPFDAGPWTVPMALRREGNSSRADLHFPPHRDETGGVMTLRLLFEDGRTAVAEFPGGKADPGLRTGAAPIAASVTARPGDDLNELARRFGTIRLQPGEYRLDRPLALYKAVTITGEPGARLVFAQPPGGPTWSSAIKIHAGHTSLEGFAVRFAGPIRWTPGVDGGPAVIGTTDNTDGTDGIPADIKADLNLRRLDLEGPPPAGKWEEAPRLMRLVRSICGVIEGNTLKGGSIEVVEGPWKIVDNHHKGTVPGTFCYGVFTLHHSHDLILEGNTARTEGPSGKTWRFLVLTESGCDDRVVNNTAVGLGPRDDDTVPGENAPEIVLTEAYSVHFEGRLSAVSGDGRVLVIPGLQAEPATTGDVVSILSGPGAGQWRRVVQAMGPTTYLVDRPLPAGEYDVSISTGFVRETIRGNTLDSRGGSVSVNLVLVGNLFDLKVIDNNLLGAGEAFKISAAPTERPVHWGWSHAPVLGAVIEGNTVEDSLRGGTFTVEHSAAIKTNRGRVYASGTVRNNTVRWSEAFLARLKEANRTPPSALTLGDPGSLDPEEIAVSLENTRSDGRGAPSIRVEAARVNGKAIRNQTIPLSGATANSSRGSVKGSSRR